MSTDLIQFFLSRHLTWTDLMSVQNRAVFHLCSSDQFYLLFSHAGLGVNDATLLDIGSGSGSVTSQLGPLFNSLECFELSTFMSSKLRRNGFTALTSAQFESLHGPTFDIVAVLNVLDVAESPISLLKRSIDLAKSAILISLPLPFIHRTSVTHEPKEIYCSRSKSFEFCSNDFIQFVESHGVRLASWTRVPYLDQPERPLHFSETMSLPVHQNIVALFVK